MTTVAEALARPANGFAAVRLALALAVVVSHAFSVTTGRVADEPLARLTGFTLGEHAVNGFFAVSGFLVTMSYGRRGPGDYVVARLLRIGPGLVAAVLLTALLLGPALTTLPAGAYLADPATGRFVVGALTTFKSNAALPGVFADNPFRAPLGTIWTLKYETLCYAGVFLAGLAGLLRRPWPATAAAAALLLALVALHALAPDAPEARRTAFRLTFLFAAGAAIYLQRDRLPASGPLALGLVAAAAALSRTPAYPAALYAATAYGVLFVALSPALARPLFDLRADLSYGTYLYGWPVQQTLREAWPEGSAAALLLPSLAVTLAVAALSWRFVERPALRLKERRLARRAAP